MSPIDRFGPPLDHGFNRYRFHLDPELIVAWKSAKHVVAGPQPKETVATPLPPARIEKPAA
jgi:hypothetical protein